MSLYPRLIFGIRVLLWSNYSGVMVMATQVRDRECRVLYPQLFEVGKRVPILVCFPSRLSKMVTLFPRYGALIVSLKHGDLNIHLNTTTMICTVWTSIQADSSAKLRRMAELFAGRIIDCLSRLGIQRVTARFEPTSMKEILTLVPRVGSRQIQKAVRLPQ